MEDSAGPAPEVLSLLAPAGAVTASSDVTATAMSGVVSSATTAKPAVPSSALAPTPIVEKRYFGVDLVELAAVSSSSVPRLLIFLCEMLLQYMGSCGSPLSALREWKEFDPFESSVDIAKVRAAVDAGDFDANMDPALLFYLLKCFVRELPTPIVPPSYYAEALRIPPAQLKKGDVIICGVCLAKLALCRRGGTEPESALQGSSSVAWVGGRSARAARVARGGGKGRRPRSPCHQRQDRRAGKSTSNRCQRLFLFTYTQCYRSRRGMFLHARSLFVLADIALVLR